MTHEDYEQRKQRLAEQLREGVALLEQGYQRQLRALELIWLADSGGDPVPTGHGSSEDAVPAGAPAPPVRPRLVAGQLLEDLRTALAQMPQVFDRHNLIRALGYEPERSSLHRAMARLLQEGDVALDSYGAGSTPARYRKTGS